MTDPTPLDPANTAVGQREQGKKDQNHEAGTGPDRCASRRRMNKCPAAAKTQTNTHMEHTEIWELIK